MITTVIWIFFKSVGDATAAGTNEVWENRNGVFVNVTMDVGLTLSRNRYRGMTIGDFDNDGDKDIFLQLNIDPSLDCLLVNDELSSGARAFEDVAEFAGITKTGDRKGSAFLDYDMDGFLDIYLPSAEHNHILYHNLHDNGTNWIGFRLEGVVSNRSAIGSLVTIHTGDKKQVCYTICGNGNLRQDNPYVHFGLGYLTKVDSAVIHWPSGTHQLLSGLAINTYHKIKEKAAIDRVDDAGVNHQAPHTCRLEQNYPNPFNPSTHLAFLLNKRTRVRLEVMDALGKRLVTLIDAEHPSGHHDVIWNGCDELGMKVATGIYFYRMVTDDFSMTRKMVLMQ
jgi:hypothetical protein